MTVDEDEAIELEQERKKEKFKRDVDRHILQSKLAILLAMDTSTDEEKKYFKKLEKKPSPPSPNPFKKEVL